MALVLDTLRFFTNFNPIKHKKNGAANVPVIP